MRVVVDALGGDAAPREPTAGAILAAREFPDTTILLAGPEQAIQSELRKHLRRPSNLQILPASQHIGMHEPPVQALRGKRDSSIVVGIEQVARGEAEAFVSAGNTGAVVAASSLGLGVIPGVQRPGIAVPMRALGHTFVTIDVGANIQCKPTHLLQYAVMATVFARDVLDIEDPRVGLLNVGEEARKGTDLLKDAYGLLSASSLRFIGNVEANDIILDGNCDIVVCDGFVGNVMLKTSESVAMKLLNYLEGEIKKNLLRRIGFALCKRAFEAVRHCGDYAEYGGAPLLGVKGVTIISHGRSDAKAILNAVREARRFVRREVNDKIGEAVRAEMPPNANSKR